MTTGVCFCQLYEEDNDDYIFYEFYTFHIFSFYIKKKILFLSNIHIGDTYCFPFYYFLLPTADIHLNIQVLG